MKLHICCQKKQTGSTWRSHQGENLNYDVIKKIQHQKYAKKIAAMQERKDSIKYQHILDENAE